MYIIHEVSKLMGVCYNCVKYFNDHYYHKRDIRNKICGQKLQVTEVMLQLTDHVTISRTNDGKRDIAIERNKNYMNRKCRTVNKE